MGTVKSPLVSRILVVLPSLNEGVTISALVTEATEACSSINAELEFLVADDSQGSDQALNELAVQDSRVRLFIPTSRLGHQRGQSCFSLMTS